MKLSIAIASILMTFSAFSAKAQDTNGTLPELNVIRSAVLTSDSGDFRYDNKKKHHLYLSSYSLAAADPDLYLSSYKKTDYFMLSGLQEAGFSVMTDLGNVPLERLSVAGSLNPGPQAEAVVLDRSAPLIENHTYMVLLNSSVARGMILFRVEAIKNDQVFISYAVKRYDIIKILKAAPDFDKYKWNNKDEHSSDFPESSKPLIKPLSKNGDLNYHLKSLFS